MSIVALLPSEFAELEPHAQRWSLETEASRWAERMGSPMADLQEFYDAIFPHVPEAIRYCDKFQLDDMPEDAINLLRLVYSFVLVSFPVELWGQPMVPGTGGTTFDRISEPLP